MKAHRRALQVSLIGLGLVTGLAGAGLVAAADDTPAAHSDSVGAAISDTGITAKVKAKYLGDDRLKSAHIKVVTTNGVVTLTGSAPSSDTKSAAEELAQSVEGVKSVDDQLKTAADHGTLHHVAAKTEREGSDSWITTKVKSEILADSVSKGFEVSVKTTGGVVILTGTLANNDAVAHVKDLAEKVKGVKSVDTTHLATVS